MKKNYYHINDEKLYYKIINGLKISKEKSIIFLNGDVGSGKTTFVKSYLSSLSGDSHATSPTFTIVNEYVDTKNQKIYHYDFYRLKNKNELFEIGIDYYLEQPGIHFIEWSKEFLNYLPEPDINISFLMLEKSRIIKVEVNNEK